MWVRALRGWGRRSRAGRWEHHVAVLSIHTHSTPNAVIAPSRAVCCRELHGSELKNALCFPVPANERHIPSLSTSGVSAPPLPCFSQAFSQHTHSFIYGLSIS